MNIPASKFANVDPIDSWRLPTHVDGITTDLLSELISRMHAGTCVESFEVLEAQGLGGMVSTAGRVKMRLRYAPGSPPLPERVLLKMVIETPGVPGCFYETEVNMYERLLSSLDIERPVCLAAAYEPHTDRFMLILEDMSIRGAEFTYVLKPPLTPDQVGRLLDTLAYIHAHFWQSPILDRESAWLGSLTAGRQFETFDTIIVASMDANVAESTYRQDFVSRVGRSPAELWDLVKAVHRHQEATMPMTLCHGDTGAHNTFHLPGSRSGFVDWQLSCKAAWPHDVHYLICTALSVKDRRVHERALVERYLARLAEMGVAHAPSPEQAMAEYSLAIIWGLTIGWFAVPSSMYGMEIITANVERLLAAAMDHDLFDRAEQLL